MRRKIADQLVAWKNSSNRMPLLLNGARQVGKTYILKWFGENYYDNYVHINIEINSAVKAFFESDLTPAHIVQYLETVSNQRIIPGKTLIILDEIQASKRALLSLKSFCEDAPESHVAAAGSLLGVALKKEQEVYSFPVGKVNEMNMYPLDFKEFLWAVDKDILVEEIIMHFESNEMMPSATHELALSLFKQYLITGGMPASVSSFVETNSFLTVSEALGNILNEYIADMAKYAEPSTTVKVRACYNSIPAQLAKENRKFQYKVVKQGATSTYFGEALDWLEQAGIVLKCKKISHGYMPIAVYEDLSDFKLYMSDIGMLTMKAGMAHQTILSPIEEDNTFMGAMTENYVAQAFAANGYPLYYWKNDNTAELDFVLQKGVDIIPIEVKKGKRVRAASLDLFMKSYKCRYAIRISKKNFGFANQIKSVPLYAVFCI